MISRLLITTALISLPAAMTFTGHAHAGEGVGFPQLDISTYPSQLFWLTIAFVVLYTLMSKIALPRIAAVLDTRRTKREKDLSRAEELQRDVTEIRETYEAALAKAHDDAQELLSTLEADLAKTMEKQNAKFSDDAHKRIAKAEKAIDDAKAEALTSIADVATEIAAEAASKISGTLIAQSNAKKAVQKVMKEVA